MLERLRRQQLREQPYDWTTVDALLDIGDLFGRSRNAVGMVEMQRWFRKLAERERERLV